MKHFISLIDYSRYELSEILNRADYYEKAWKDNKMPKSLLNKRVGLWFYGNGFRNRLAFELGSKEMGASVSYIPGDLGIHEPLEDVGYYLQNWYSLLIIRAKSHQALTFLSKYISIPIINARTDFNHPCEIMGDLQFIRKYRGSLDGLKVIFVGELSNICMSWFEAAVKFPISVTQVAPENYLADTETLNNMNSSALGSINTSTELEPLLCKADLLYTDCWPKSDDNQMYEQIKSQFLPYQITEKDLSMLHEKAMFLPCPPVTRGEEVSDKAMASGLCLNYKAKEYLLHCQNAIMEKIMSEQN